MHVIIPMSGQGRRFREAGYSQLKPLIPVEGKPILQHLLEQFPNEWPKTFICDETHLAESSLREELVQLCPGATIVAIPSHRGGPVHAVLEACRVNPNSVPESEPCLISYCDYSMRWDALGFERFVLENECDGAVLCYTGFHPEYIRPTLYAYCKEVNGKILEIKEKGHFTPDRNQEFASCGAYYYKTGALVRQYFAQLMKDGPLINGEGYCSLIYNPMIEDNLDIRVFEIPFFLQWGTPQDLQDYEYWSRSFQQFMAKNSQKETQAIQLLMPMAGRGSRFAGGLPKPLIPVLGKAMFCSAIDYLPETQKKVLVLQGDISQEIAAAYPTAIRVELSGISAGQAISTKLGIPDVTPNMPVLISSCDHGLLWSNERWQRLIAQDPDVIVWGQRNYGGADVKPEAFAYIQAENSNSDRIANVSVKVPLSASPRKDLLLVGTFYFRSPALLEEMIEELERRDIRVNGELYLDSVINLCVERGLDVRVFEGDGYLCWGTPEALAEFTYWHRFFVEHKNVTI